MRLTFIFSGGYGHGSGSGGSSSWNLKPIYVQASGEDDCTC